jgi:hypothetical protein
MYSTAVCQPFTETRVKTQINPGLKQDEATAHESQYKIMKQDTCNIVCYTYVLILNETIGVGTVVEMTREAVIEATYAIAHQQEVYDAKLLGIFIYLFIYLFIIKHAACRHGLVRYTQITLNKNNKLNRTKAKRKIPG